MLAYFSYPSNPNGMRRVLQHNGSIIINAIAIAFIILDICNLCIYVIFHGSLCLHFYILDTVIYEKHRNVTHNPPLSQEILISTAHYSKNILCLVTENRILSCCFCCILLGSKRCRQFKVQ